MNRYGWLIGILLLVVFLGVIRINFWGHGYHLTYATTTPDGQLNKGTLTPTDEFFALKDLRWNGPLEIYLAEVGYEIDGFAFRDSARFIFYGKKPSVEIINRLKSWNRDSLFSNQACLVKKE